MHMHLKIPVLTHTSLHFNNIPIKEQSQCLTRIEWLIYGTMIPKTYIYTNINSNPLQLCIITQISET